VATQIGARLRGARLEQGLSLRGVAEAVGVSASLVSQVETGKTQPSVSTLYAMVSHLGISMDELLDDGDPPARRRRSRSEPRPAPTAPAHPRFGHGGQNPVLEMENGVRWERLASGDDGPADALLVTYEPGASSSIEGRLMRHSGIEYAYLLEGELELQLEFDTFVLRAGDSLQFDSVRPHLYANRGDAPARGVWFVVGRRRPGDAPVSRASGP
jgi:transcriptional regulator with XRE-family HTH domain